MTNTHSPQLTQLLTKLVGFRTYSYDHIANLQAITWIVDQLADIPLHITRPSGTEFPALIITTKPTKTPKLWLQAHLDVVPASPAAFDAKIVGDKLYGRGAFDMKFAIASYLLLLQELGPSAPNYDFGVMITTDEEIGGEHGVKHLLAAGHTANAAFLPDGGKDWQFVSASRGMWHLRATATGHAGHGARPWLGQNAIHLLSRFLEELVTLFPTEPCTTPNHFHDSINIGTFQGGEATNQIPASANAQIDIRYLPESKAGLHQAITKLLAGHPSVSLETLVEGPGYQVERNDPYFKAYATALARHHIKPQFNITHGSSDARHFAAAHIPAIVLRPAGGGHHSEREWISIKELNKFHGILKDFISCTI